MKKLAMILLIMTTLTACSGTELRDQLFISEIGADHTDRLSLTLRLYGEDEPLSGEGDSFFSALSDCESGQGKRLFAGHLEVFALSPDRFKDDLMTVLQNNRISPSCHVLCVRENASGFIGENKDKLKELIDSGGRNGLIVPKNIGDAVNDLLEKDGKAAVPMMKDDKLTMAVVSENELIGTLTEDESRGLCWLCGGVSDLYIPIKTDEGKTDFHVIKSSTKITAQKMQDGYGIVTEIKINGNAESDSIASDTVKAKLSEMITAECSLTIAKTVTGMGADLFGIEKSLNAKLLAMNETWEETAHRLKFYYKVKIAE